MSWETLLTGWLTFKADTSREIVDEALKKFSEACQCEPKWDEAWRMWHFEDLNWASHVEGARIAKVFNEYKTHIKKCSFSIYYLSEADEFIEYNKDEGEEEIWLV